MPPPDRNELRVATWISRKLPPRDYLLGDILCTTSVGFSLAKRASVKRLLRLKWLQRSSEAPAFWVEQPAACVMYLDGEMPAETLKERIAVVALRYDACLVLPGSLQILGTCASADPSRRRIRDQRQNPAYFKSRTLNLEAALLSANRPAKSCSYIAHSNQVLCRSFLILFLR